MRVPKTLWLNVEHTKKAKSFDAAGMPSHVMAWYVCPACCLVVYTPDSPPVSCTRNDDNDPAAWLRGKLLSRQNGDCSQPSVKIADIAPRVADMLESVYRVGGLNAVIRSLDGLTGIDIGIDDPGGVVPSAKMASLDHLRPESVAPERPRGQVWKKK